MIKQIQRGEDNRRGRNEGHGQDIYDDDDDDGDRYGSSMVGITDEVEA